MSRHNYNLHLKGYVGGWDFDSDVVDYTLSKHPEEEVNILIDSLGGSLATALSIVAAFKNHGNVHVHYVGMNASAATIASLGAKHVLALIAKNLSEHLNEAIWSGKRLDTGDTTQDLFNGFDTITDTEVTAGNISADNGNYLKLDEAITTANAVDVAKEILFGLDPRLRAMDLNMYCSQAKQVFTIATKCRYVPVLVSNTHCEGSALAAVSMALAIIWQ